MSKGKRLRARKVQRLGDSFFEAVGVLLVRWQSCVFALARIELAERQLPPAAPETLEVLRCWAEKDVSEVATELERYCDGEELTLEAIEEARNAVNAAKHGFFMPGDDGTINLLRDQSGHPDHDGLVTFPWFKRGEPAIYRLSQANLGSATVTCHRMAQVLGEEFKREFNRHLRKSGTDRNKRESE